MLMPFFPALGFVSPAFFDMQRANQRRESEERGNSLLGSALPKAVGDPRLMTHPLLPGEH